MVDINPEQMKNVLPIGVFPSEGDIDANDAEPAMQHKKRFSVNEVSLMGTGDILLLQTDGLYEHSNGDELFATHRLEESIRSVKDLPPHEIVAALYEDMVRFAPPKDDTSLVVIKKVR